MTPVDITDDTDFPAEIASAAATATAAIHRLAELSRAAGEMGDMVTAIEALTADSGPLAELIDTFGNAAGWLVDFEDDDAAVAADRMDDAASNVDDLKYNLRLALARLQPLTGTTEDAGDDQEDEEVLNELESLAREDDQADEDEELGPAAAEVSDEDMAAEVAEIMRESLEDAGDIRHYPNGTRFLPHPADEAEDEDTCECGCPTASHSPAGCRLCQCPKPGTFRSAPGS